MRINSLTESTRHVSDFLCSIVIGNNYKVYTCFDCVDVIEGFAIKLPIVTQNCLK